MQRRVYPEGTKIREKNGRVIVKIRDDEGNLKWESEARRMWELYHGELKPGDRVFLIKGVGSKIERNNLCMVHYRTEPWKVLDHREILFLPVIRTLDKRTGKVLVHS